MEKIKIINKKIEKNKLPTEPGVYLFLDPEEKPLYVGKAKNLKNRVSSYFSSNTSEKIQIFLAEATHLAYILVENEFDALILEANLIQKFQPRYNVDLKDDKSYPYIKITAKAVIPQVLIVRQKNDDNAVYFGPYPDASSVHRLVKLLRKTFPFCTHKKPYQSCLYAHLGLCPLPYKNISEKDYKKNIRKIKLILEGKRHLVAEELNNQILNLSNNENFEEAQVIKKQLESLNKLITYKINTQDYLNDTDSLIKKRALEMESLVKYLNLNHLDITKASRIECYDISNTMGTFATASMVVLINGSPDKREYRRFRIKLVKGINDFLMIKEALTRRLRHKEWPYPDLLLIDGGFGQLKFAKEALEEAHLNIPCISLAKREEQICLPNGQMLTLNHQDPALHILQRVRDEAHRFAKKYHSLLRLKNFKSTMKINEKHF